MLALSAGGLTGILGSYYLNNSRYATEVSALATYRPPQVTKIYADDGETVLAEFALEKRIPIKEQDIPKTVEKQRYMVSVAPKAASPGKWVEMPRMPIPTGGAAGAMIARAWPTIAFSGHTG